MASQNRNCLTWAAGSGRRCAALRAACLTRALGITRVPWQVEQARALNDIAGCGERVRVIEGDYEELPSCPSSGYDAVYARRAVATPTARTRAYCSGRHTACCGPVDDWSSADGFLAGGQFVSGLQKRIYRKLCECWVIEELAQLDLFTARLEQLGFTGHHHRALADAGRAFGCAHPMGDVEVPADGRRVRQAQDDTGALEQCAGAGFAATGQCAAGADDLLHDHGNENLNFEWIVRAGLCVRVLFVHLANHC